MSGDGVGRQATRYWQQDVTCAAKISNKITKKTQSWIYDQINGNNCKVSRNDGDLLRSAENIEAEVAEEVKTVAGLLSGSGTVAQSFHL